MKKYTFIIILLVLCAVFNSCQSCLYKNTEIIESSNDSEGTKAVESDFLMLDENNNVIGLHGEPLLEYNRSFYISSFSEYEQFLKIVNLPDTFVTYDQISALGEFYLFYKLDRDSYETYDTISYWFGNEDNCFYVKINSESTFLPKLLSKYKEVSFEDIDKQDVKNIAEAEDNFLQYFCYQNIYYVYLRGNLKYIMWQSGHYSYDIDFGDYEFGKNLIDSKLLDPPQAYELICSIAPPDPITIPEPNETENKTTETERGLRY